MRKSIGRGGSAILQNRAFERGRARFWRIALLAEQAAHCGGDGVHPLFADPLLVGHAQIAEDTRPAAVVGLVCQTGDDVEVDVGVFGLLGELLERLGSRTGAEIEWVASEHA